MANLGETETLDLLIYYDYRPIQFRIEGQEKYVGRFEFTLKDSQEINMSTYLNDNEIVPDELCHFLTFVFTPSPNEYAKDKETVTYNSAQVYNYNLYFESYDEKKSFVGNNYELYKAGEYYPYESTPLILNTQTDMKEISETVHLPSKCYSVNAESLFEMNYIVSNLGGNSKTAILFLEVGNEHTNINNQEYIFRFKQRIYGS